MSFYACCCKVLGNTIKRVWTPLTLHRLLLVAQVNLQIRAANNLDTIVLASCGSLTDECLHPLRDLLQLKSLTLKGGYNITWKTLVNLKGLVHLTYLNISGALGLETAPLHGYKSLNALDLSSCTSLVSISFPADLPLRQLNLQGCPKLTEGSLTSLHRLKCLQHLNLSGSAITNTTLADLQASKMQASNICYDDSHQRHRFATLRGAHMGIHKHVSVLIPFGDWQMLRATHASQFELPRKIYIIEPHSAHSKLFLICPGPQHLLLYSDQQFGPDNYQ